MELPAEYNDWVLCQMYHCLPSELENEDLTVLNMHLLFKEAEVRAQSFKAKLRR